MFFAILRWLTLFYNLRLQNIIGVVTQFPYFFHETLEDNLKIGRSISEEVLEQSLRYVNAKEIIDDKKLMRFDENISGGQKERLAIARELMGKKPILIMDESTASLDAPTARLVEKNILTIPGLTVIMITHHLYDGSVRYIDEIIRL